MYSFALNEVGVHAERYFPLCGHRGVGGVSGFAFWEHTQHTPGGGRHQTVSTVEEHIRPQRDMHGLTLFVLTSIDMKKAAG